MAAKGQIHLYQNNLLRPDKVEQKNRSKNISFSIGPTDNDEVEPNYNLKTQIKGIRYSSYNNQSKKTKPKNLEYKITLPSSTLNKHAKHKNTFAESRNINTDNVQKENTLLKSTLIQKGQLSPNKTTYNNRREERTFNKVSDEGVLQGQNTQTLKSKKVCRLSLQTKAELLYEKIKHRSIDHSNVTNFSGYQNTVTINPNIKTTFINKTISENNKSPKRTDRVTEKTIKFKEACEESKFNTIATHTEKDKLEQSDKKSNLKDTVNQNGNHTEDKTAIEHTIENDMSMIQNAYSFGNDFFSSSIKPVMRHLADVDVSFPWNAKLNKFNSDNYTIIKELRDNFLGKTYLVNDLFGYRYNLLKHYSVASNELEAFFNLIDLINLYPHANLLRVLAIAIIPIEKRSFCLNCLFESELMDLETFMSQINLTGSTMEEIDLLYIMKDCLAALSSLNKNKASHGNISPNNIFFFKKELTTADIKDYDLNRHNQIFKVKLSVPFIEDITKNKFLHLNDYANLRSLLQLNNHFLSPALYNMKLRNRYDLKHDSTKSDIFSLGMSILFAATNGNTRILQELRTKLDHEGIWTHISRHLKNYSTDFIDIISYTLILDERKRISLPLLTEKVSNLIKNIERKELEN